MTIVSGCRPSTPEPEAPVAWTDTSAHEVARLEVGAGVELEVLDWGGSGPALVFLAGLGNTAHAFDDFGPRFLDDFRVLAITRRGFGESSHPGVGFDAETLTQDILSVLDAKEIESAYFAGHSIAAIELTTLGSRFPERVRKLVYLDTYCTMPEALPLLSSMFATPPEGMAKPVEPAEPDTATVEGYIAFVHASRGVSIPVSDIRARFASDGWNEAATPSYQSVLGTAMSLPTMCADVKTPSLAIIAERTSIEQEEPWIQSDTASWPAQREFQRRGQDLNRVVVEQFPLAIPNSQVVPIQGGHHWIFTSHADEVEREMRAFLR